MAKNNKENVEVKDSQATTDSEDSAKDKSVDLKESLTREEIVEIVKELLGETKIDEQELARVLEAEISKIEIPEAAILESGELVYDIVERGTLKQICEHCNKSSLKIKEVDLVGGLFRALCYQASVDGELEVIQMNNAQSSIQFINRLKGNIEKVVYLKSGAAQFICRFNEDDKAEGLKEIEEEKKQAEEAEIAKSKEEKLASIKKQKELLEEEEKQLKA